MTAFPVAGRAAAACDSRTDGVPRNGRMRSADAGPIIPAVAGRGLRAATPGTPSSAPIGSSSLPDT